MRLISVKTSATPDTADGGRGRSIGD
jgi:hypothetical protein